MITTLIILLSLYGQVVDSSRVTVESNKTAVIVAPQVQQTSPSSVTFYAATPPPTVTITTATAALAPQFVHVLVPAPSYNYGYGYGYAAPVFVRRHGHHYGRRCVRGYCY